MTEERPLRLTPVQQGMLFEYVRSPAEGRYVAQMKWRLDGVVDAHALRHAWQDVVRTHEVFRTGFSWLDVDAPSQTVVPDATCEWIEQDWRSLSAGDCVARLDTYLGLDRRRGFDLSAPP